MLVLAVIFLGFLLLDACERDGSSKYPRNRGRTTFNSRNRGRTTFNLRAIGDAPRLISFSPLIH